MAIYDYVTETQKKVEERLFKESVTEGIFSKQYSFAGVKTIVTKSVDNVPLTPYDRTLTDNGQEGTIGNRFGPTIELASTKNEYTMEHEVKYNLGWEKSSNSDEHEIRTASSVISRQDREIVIPYRDKYRLNKIALGAGLNRYGMTTSADLGRTKILETLLKARAEMANKYVAMGKQVLYIGETDAIEMKLADQVIGSDIISEKPIVNGTIGKLGGFQLKLIPDDYLPSGCAFLIVTKGSAWSPVKVKTSRVNTKPEDFDGTKVQYHEYFDCFVNKMRADTIFAGWTSAQPGA